MPAAQMPLDQEFGPVLRSVGSRYFERVRFPVEAENELRELTRKGFVIHVMRTTAWVNYLYLAWVLVRRGLPPIRAVVNLRNWFTRPWRKTAQRGGFAARFKYARKHHGSGLIFLHRSLLMTPAGAKMKEDPFPELVALARKSDRPVYLVPELFVWEKWTTPLQPGPMDYLFGSPDAPGFLHSLMAFWRNYQRAQFRVGEPIDLRQFIADHPDESDERIARKVRSALHHHLARETRAVFGPVSKSTDRLLYEIIRDRDMQHALEEHAQAQKRPKAQVRQEVLQNLKTIAARTHQTVVAIVSPVLEWVFNRIYEGIDVDEEGLERALKAASRSPLVLCPSHKSHVDYLVLSWVLWNRGYAVPLVAAGANLSFFPLGVVLRRVGAYFLRRSFRGDPLYTLAFKSYVRKLVREGAHQEFFLEGGRSRSGKLLMPKLGLLTWQVEAMLEGAAKDLTFVPVALDYDKIVESKSLTHEMTGGEKRPEDFKALLSTPKILSARYGRIYLTFNEPISLVEFAKSRGLDITQPISEEQKKLLVRALGNRIMHGISRVSTLTSQALVSAAVLAHRRRGVTARELTHRIGLLRRCAEEEGIPRSEPLNNAPSDPTVLGPIRQAAEAFAQEGLVQIIQLRGETVYQAVDERRVELSLYKNTLLNMVASRSLVANAVLAGKNETAAQIQARALFLSRLFKFEFIYEVGVSFLSLFDQAVDKLVRLGLVIKTDATLVVAPEAHARPELEFHADLLRDYLEAYWVTTLTSGDLRGPMESKSFVRDVLEKGKVEFLAGRIGAFESLNRMTIENAVAYLKDQGFLAETDKKLALTDKGQEPSQREALAAKIREYVVRDSGG